MEIARRETEDVQAFKHFKVLPWGPKVKSQNVDCVIMCFVYLGRGILVLWISEDCALQKILNSSQAIKIVRGALSGQPLHTSETNAVVGSPNRSS